jgi:ABC-type antimicrobial peptide transport system permease subunit
MLMRGLKLTGSGIIIGVLLSLWTMRILESQLYEIQVSDPATYGIVTVFLVAIAFLATWLPARRASRIDPSIALQYE